MVVNKKMKIFFLGGEDVSARIELSKKMTALGHEITIIGSEKQDKFERDNIRYLTYSLEREFNPFSDIKTVMQLRAILKKEKRVSVVHAFDTKPTMFLPIAALGLNHIKVVRTITGMGRIFTEKSVKNTILVTFYNVIQMLVRPMVDCTIFQNDDDRDYFIAHHLINKTKAAVVKSSGIDLKTLDFPVETEKIALLRKELGLDAALPTFILVSRMVKQKGVLNYLEAARLCHETGHRYNFLLVGQIDSNKDSLAVEQIMEYSAYVNYLGRREDVKDLLSLSDVFVLPTYYREGVPRVLLEASAMGLALIATDMPGCKDVVKDGYNGYLVNIKDSRDLFTKMCSIAEDKVRLTQFSRNSRAYVKNFDLEIIVSRYNDIYNKVIR